MLGPKDVIDEPVFTHHNELTGALTHIAAKKLAQYCEGKDQLTKPVAVNEDLYKKILIHNGVERHQIEYWKREYLKNHNQPLPIFVEWEDGHHTLVDGNHRFCALYELGLSRILCYIVPPRIWRRYQVAIPEILETLIKTSNYLQGSYSHLRQPQPTKK